MSDTNAQTMDRPEEVELGISTALRVLGNQEIPFEVGSIEVGEGGEIRAREHGRPLSFCFVYLGIGFEAQVTTGDAPQVCLAARLGRLPFTVESPSNRRSVKHMLKLNGRLPRASFVLEAGNEVRMTAERIPPSPRTPVSIMATVTAMLLELGPHLAVLREALIRLPSEAAGAA